MDLTKPSGWSCEFRVILLSFRCSIVAEDDVICGWTSETGREEENWRIEYCTRLCISRGGGDYHLLKDGWMNKFSISKCRVEWIMCIFAKENAKTRRERKRSHSIELLCHCCCGDHPHDTSSNSGTLCNRKCSEWKQWRILGRAKNFKKNLLKAQLSLFLNSKRIQLTINNITPQLFVWI